MLQENCTEMLDFMLLAFPTQPEHQVLLFLGISMVYAAIITGNLLIIVAIWAKPHLHTPMYFFLGTLSVVELCYTAAVVPQILVTSLQERKFITFRSCCAQMFFFIGLGSADCFLLAIMAYDRYVAICKPLRYTLIMTQELCIQLVGASLLIGFLVSLMLIWLVFHLPFCGGYGIEHYFCDVPPVSQLTSNKTKLNEVGIFLSGIMAITVPFILICTSYLFIAVSVLQVHSADSRRKAISTCSSHLAVVALQYGCCSFMYLRPSSSFSPKQDQMLSMVYTLGTPLLNPIIYSLRNKEVKAALRQVISHQLLRRGY
ncbi:olfactory receptor 10W1-like isoform X2 [Rhineura floridana]|nr:olfactory receptor 10W1-like isoform X2 [Rhineura floridana]XP_061465683.1 olfactory receptor 10W1-like isoform X2 [Rhineura floridana]XP_061465684.1 olfactory receptor 10W1-like isoform X2 [Rhineura floridana]